MHTNDLIYSFPLYKNIPNFALPCLKYPLFFQCAHACFYAFFVIKEFSQENVLMNRQEINEINSSEIAYSLKMDKYILFVFE